MTKRNFPWKYTLIFLLDELQSQVNPGSTYTIGGSKLPIYTSHHPGDCGEVTCPSSASPL